MPIRTDPAAARPRGLPVMGRLALAALLATGCAGGPDAASPAAPTGTPGATASAAVLATSSPAPAGDTPTPAASAAGPSGDAADAPPSATLASPGDAATPGELGGYTWAGAGSDSPWLVPPPAAAVRSAGPYTVALDPSLPVDGWTARWAPIDRDGTAGETSASADGAGGPVVLAGAPGPGPWSLQVDVRFAGGGRAAWYWRVEPSG